MYIYSALEVTYSSPRRPSNNMESPPRSFSGRVPDGRAGLRVAGPRRRRPSRGLPEATGRGEENILCKTCRFQWQPLESAKGPRIVLRDPRTMQKIFPEVSTPLQKRFQMVHRPLRIPDGLTRPLVNPAVTTRVPEIIHNSSGRTSDIL